ncbi:zinc ribbon domain-containing protein [Roseomonas sp. GC11]|uniref:FmdB family zinc ribbon protein n=1 Tax=Roseomonas sp. GC11 TaxID=2950546 RepID=UPI00210EE783|nr:FmdB family zinc ribbon protein [Roseomonas sp. GC11]MCQ4158910.1 zinc ribbon domain-containing protein [Roseomonas sp. GC11]
MPVYDYACGACGPFTAFRPMAASREACACPGCGAAAPRAFLTGPRLAVMEAGARRAHATNERSAHAPRRSAGHAPGCACCGPSPFPRKAAATAAEAKSFPGRRPWMISH